MQELVRLLKKLKRWIRVHLWTILLVCVAVAAAAAVLLIVFLHPGEGPIGHQMQNYHVLPGGDYACGFGFEGLRVKRTIEYFGLKETTGMGGAFFDEKTQAAVLQFQTEQGLPATGTVDLATWKAMGLSEAEWNLCGAYQSPAAVPANATRQERIEAMIARAYEYLGDPYVIGASGPPGSGYGLDCSGLVMQGLYAAGFAMDDINPITHAQPGHEYESRNMWASDHFTFVDYEERERGDLIFYCNSVGVVTHVAIYLGNDQVIESWPNEVQVSAMADTRHYLILGVKRAFTEE